MVLLHGLDLTGRNGISRYNLELGAALESLGEPVRRLAIRRREVRFAGRRWGGHLSIRLQNVWRPLVKTDILHSTHLYATHPRADVVTVHDCFPEQHAREYGMGGVELRYFSHLFARVERRRPVYITPTRAVRDAFVGLHPDVELERVHVTYEGVSSRFCPLAPGEARHAAVDGTAFNVLVVADPHPRKRVDWLYEAVARCLADGVKLRLLHVGGPADPRPAWQAQQQRETAAAVPLGPRLVRLGRLPEEELASVYRSADLLVAPSLDEGFGFPPLEALRSGTPVAVTDRPVFREVLGPNASYFAGPDDLAKVLAQAARAGAPSPSGRERNHRFVRDTYSWESAARLTLGAYAAARRARPS